MFNLERELGRERLRVRALEEALETPLNVHRWRKLQGTDPESVHLTQKLRLTQKSVFIITFHFIDIKMDISQKNLHLRTSLNANRSVTL